MDRIGQCANSEPRRVPTAEIVIRDMDHLGERLNSFRCRITETLEKYSPPLATTECGGEIPIRERSSSAEVWVSMFAKIETLNDLLTEIEMALARAEL